MRELLQELRKNGVEPCCPRCGKQGVRLPAESRILPGFHICEACAEREAQGREAGWAILSEPLEDEDFRRETRRALKELRTSGNSVRRCRMLQKACLIGMLLGILAMLGLGLAVSLIH